MNETLEVVWAVLDPFPVSAAGGSVVAVFSAFILCVALLGVANELLLWLRAVRLKRLLGRHTPEAFATLDAAQGFVGELERAHPELGPGARKLLESCFEADGAVLIEHAVAEHFSMDQLRAPRGLVLVPPAVLESLPGILTAIGVFGTFVGLVKGLGDYQHSLDSADFEGGIRVLIAGLSISFRTSVWGLLTSISLTFVGRWSVGQSEAAIDRLTGFLDDHLQRGADRDVQLRVLAHQAEAVDLLRELVARLAPTLAEVTRMSAEATEDTRAFVSEATQTQVDGITRIIDKVMAGMDQALGANMRQAGASLVATSEAQRDILLGWTEGVARIDRLVSSLDGVTAGLRSGALELVAAGAPMVAASERFERAASQLSAVLPLLEQTAGSYGHAQQGLDQASSALAQGTGAYQQAAELLGQRVEDLREAQDAAIVQVRAGVDDALLGPLQEAGGQLRAQAQAQAQALQSWQQATERLNELVGGLERAGAQLQAVAEDVAQAGAPSVEAAASFSAAASTMSAAIPLLQGAAEAHREAIVSGAELHREAVVSAAASHQQAIASAAGAHEAALGRGVAIQAQGMEAIRDELRHASHALARGTEGYESASERILALGASLVQVQEAAAEREQALAQLLPALAALSATTVVLERLVGSFHAANDAASGAAERLERTASSLTGAVQQVDRSTGTMASLGRELTGAATILVDATQGFDGASQRLDALVSGLDSALLRQDAQADRVARALDQATTLSELLPAASGGVGEAADRVARALSRSEGFVDALGSTVQAQDEALQRMQATASSVLEVLSQHGTQAGDFVRDLRTVQQALSDTITTVNRELPAAIDGTLVHFDAALGEGVARLGSAVERLRESMDDLQERLEALQRAGSW